MGSSYVRNLCTFGLLVVCLTLPGLALAQLWNGILGTSRAVDWATVAPAIPSSTYTQCGSTIAAYGSSGTPGSPTTIQNALNACGTDQYVQLGTGTFYLNGGLQVTVNRTELRGMGADQTFIIFSGNLGTSCGFAFLTPAIGLCQTVGSRNSANWTAGYAKGTTVITLSSTTGIAVGSVLTLEQLDEASDGYPATGDLYICSAGPTACSYEGGGDDRDRAGASNIQQVEVTAINGSDITISPGIMDPHIRSGQSPTARWLASSSQYSVRRGIKNLSYDFSSVGKNGVIMIDCKECWIQGVRSIYNHTAVTDGSAVTVINGMKNTIRDSYFFGPLSTANTAYPVRVESTGNFLFENNIMQSITAEVISNMGTSLAVIGYNFFPGGHGPGFGHHGAGEMMNLVEGNLTMGVWGDVTHGTHAFMTVFRNAMIGDRYTTGGGTVTDAITFESNMRFNNVVGNVMGDSRFTAYSSELQAGSDNAIYRIGGNTHGGSGPASDTNVKRTLLRWGNWDTVTSTADTTDGDQTGTRWCGNSSNTGWSTRCASTTEVPSGITNYPNPIPSTETLPNSFYLSAKPSWVAASKPWPFIGPDVSGGNITGLGGHAYTNPAADCYLTVMGGAANGTGGPYTFNADTCYASVLSDPPTASITAPTSGTTYSTNTTPLTTLAGGATDDVGVTSVTWACPTCTPTSGTATCATCGSTATAPSWSVASIGLASGANVITVTANDADTQTGTDALTVTYTPLTAAPTILRLVK